MLGCLKSTEKDGFFNTHDHIILGEKILYSRRGHCEHLNQFIAFSEKAAKNLKNFFS
jgi:hypothetical protein